LIVVDTSLVIALVLREANVANAASVYDALLADRLAVPAHWPAEVANALWANKRRGRIPADRLAFFVEDLFAFRPMIDPAPTAERILSLVAFAEAEKLTVYDAIYVELARTLNATLATIDADMRACARRLDIPLLPA
jgi:predicted nucleic acid-binding protein